MPKVTQYAQVATSVLGDVAAIYAIYQAAEPSAKATIANDLTKLKTGAGEVMTAVAGWRAASLFGKVAASFSVFGAIDDGIDVLKGIYADGAALFQSEWPQVQARVASIESALTTGTVLAVPVVAAGSASA